jgi:hypothetical protein
MRWLVLTTALAVACGDPAPNPETPIPAPQGVLHAPSELGGDFSLDHRITIRWQGRDASFRGVMEKRGDSLTLVGLAPHGGRGFVLRQEGLEVSFESQLPEALPFPPEHILMTLHRAWLLGIGTVVLADGEHRVERDGEEIVETWSGGRLTSRSFRALDGTPSGLFEITYEGGFDPSHASAPTRVIVRDGWVGYELEADAISMAPLRPIEGPPIEAPPSEAAPVSAPAE